MKEEGFLFRHAVASMHTTFPGLQPLTDGHEFWKHLICLLACNGKPPTSETHCLRALAVSRTLLFVIEQNHHIYLHTYIHKLLCVFTYAFIYHNERHGRATGRIGSACVQHS